MSRMSLDLDDGRSLEVELAGSGEGPLLLYHHGTPASCVIPRALAHAAERKGWRVAQASRAGYGESSRHAGRTVADVVPDSRAVLDALGVERALVAGASGGGPHALACAALLPDRVMAALVLAGIGPFRAPGLDYLAGMGEANVVEFGKALVGEATLRPYLETESEGMRGATPAQVPEQLSSILPDVDKACLTGEFGEDLLAAVEHGLSPGVDGWLDDDLAFLAPFGFDLSAIRVPVSLWQGSLDLMVPYAHGQWLAAHVGGVVPHLVEGEGHLSIQLGMIDQQFDELARLADLA